MILKWAGEAIFALDTGSAAPRNRTAGRQYCLGSLNYQYDTSQYRSRLIKHTDPG
jgi:hypothetical protein